MFDIGFPELVMISIVALLVIGPEKLPETIRTLSLWWGRLQRSLTNIRREIENEIGADEVRAQLRNEGVMDDLEQAQNTLQEAKQELEQGVSETIKAAQNADGAAATPEHNGSETAQKAGARTGAAQSHGAGADRTTAPAAPGPGGKRQAPPDTPDRPGQ